MLWFSLASKLRVSRLLPVATQLGPTAKQVLVFDRLRVRSLGNSTVIVHGQPGLFLRHRQMVGIIAEKLEVLCDYRQVWKFRFQFFDIVI